jgi:hypothetical protein
MEYILLIVEFFKSKKINSYFGIIVIPVLLSFGLYSNISNCIVKNADNGNMINLLGILLGFTISLFAILLSTDNSSINEAKKSMTDFKVFGKQLSIFDIMQTSIAYVIIVECILLILNVTLPLIVSEIETKKIFLVINIGSIVHVVIILSRSLLDFYFAISKR